MFNQATINDIHAILDDCPLGDANFNLRATADVLEIEFKDRKDYRFELRSGWVSNSGPNYKYRYTESPGMHALQDKHSTDRAEKVMDAIRPWAWRVYKALQGTEDTRRRESLHSALDEYIRKNYPNVTSHVSDEDYSRISHQFEQIKNDMEELQKAHRITIEELSAIKKAVDELLASAANTTGPVFLRKAAGTVGTIMKVAMTNPEIMHKVLHYGKDAVKLLGF